MKGLDPDLRALQEVRDHVARAKAAVKAVAHYDQEQTDRLCKAMAEAGARAAPYLSGRGARRLQSALDRIQAPMDLDDFDAAAAAARLDEYLSL